MIDKLNEILKGIDKDQCDSSDGWWETSSGAEFGAKKLKEVQDLFKKLTLTDVVKSDSEQLSKRPSTSSTWECFSKADKQKKGNV